MKINMPSTYSLIRFVAILAAPFPPAVFFGDAIYDEAMTRTPLLWLAIMAGVTAGLALETGGYLAGHTFIDFVGAKKWAMSGLSFVGLLVYCAIGLYELWDSSGRIMFIVTLLVYVLIGLYDFAQGEAVKEANKEEHEATKQAKEEENKAEQERLKAQYAHELEMSELAQKYELKKLKLTSAIAPQPNQLHEISHATNETHAIAPTPQLQPDELHRLILQFRESHPSANQKGIVELLAQKGIKTSESTVSRVINKKVLSNGHIE